jgi:Flp pilus assembly secretin CpaC/tetratricopeptide (TPR) repeat protein
MRLRFHFLPALAALVFAALVSPSCQTAQTRYSAASGLPIEVKAADTMEGGATEGGAKEGGASEGNASEARAREAASPATEAVEALEATAQDLGQEAERIRLRDDRAATLAAEYIRIGDQKRDAGDLGAAVAEYSRALEVHPASREARERLGRMQALLGDRYATLAEQFRDSVDREIVRRAQAQMAAEEASRLGDLAMAQKKYDEAIARYREAQTILVYHPLVATSSLDEKIVTGKLNDALDQLEASRAAEAARAASEAEADLARREEETRNYRANKLRTIYEEANQAFLADDYERSEDLANLILADDPGNTAATALRDAAQLARHTKTDEVTRKRYREQWRRTIDELDTADVPQDTALVYDDLRRWREVSARQPLEFTAKADAVSDDTAIVLERLGNTRFTPNFRGADNEGAELAEVASFLQGVTGVNFLISSKVREELDEEQTRVRLVLPERSVKTVLDLIAETSESLRWMIRDGVVMFVTKEETYGGQILKMYEVRDIIHPVKSFPGREINISPSGGLEQPEEDLEEREGLVVTKDALETMIRENVARQSWEDDQKNTVRITESGTMVVNQTPEVQEMVQALLDDLREATGIMVDIQARFLKVEDNFLEEIGVDFRGLGQPGAGTNLFLNDFGDATTQAELGQEIGNGTDLGAFFDEGNDGDIRGRVENLYDLSLGNPEILTGSGGLAFQWTYLNDLQLQMILRAVSKSERRELVTMPKVLVFNTARANISVLNQVAYVQDFDVEIAQAASIADPIIDVIQDGVVLDVRPVVSADRRFIVMELRPTVATLRRPIREVATTLSSQNPVTIQLPEVDFQRVRTTVPMPDGGTVMLGGLKVSEKQDMRSSIPLLSKVPVVRFLFERKGTFAANQKLLILVTAKIVIPQELEPTEAQTGTR